MKIRDSRGLPCPVCGSPLIPCPCEREKGRPMVSRRNSTLKANPRKKLRSRTLREKFGDDPLRYGLVFEAVRRLPCWAKVYIPGHECGLGAVPASAHHLGTDDLDGLLPSCSLSHSDLHERVGKLAKALKTAGQPSLEAIGKSYVGQALYELKEADELTPELETTARERGFKAEIHR